MNRTSTDRHCECGFHTPTQGHRHEYPACLQCGAPCACGQVDALGRTIHFGCQHHLPPDERHPKLTQFPTHVDDQEGNPQ